MNFLSIFLESSSLRMASPFDFKAYSMLFRLKYVSQMPQKHFISSCIGLVDLTFRDVVGCPELLKNRLIKLSIMQRF